MLGANTWRELVEAGYALGDRLLYLRMPNFRGDDVLALQVKLNLFGFNAGPERGIFDTSVERALIDFQRNAGLQGDGIVGDDTLRKLEALRKAETGREGKKIPDRDEGFAPVASLTGVVVAIDPGHGGRDAGVVSPAGRAEKDLTLAVGLRLAELLRAEGSRVVMTRETDKAVPLYERTDAVEAAAADYLVSLHFNGDQNPAAAGAVGYFFQRSHYYSEHGARLSDYIGAEVGRLGGAGFIAQRGPQLRRAARTHRDRGHGRAAVSHQPRRRRPRGPPRLRRTAGARRGHRLHALPGARLGRRRLPVTPGPSAFTATQLQRLYELGADAAATDADLRRRGGSATTPSAACRPSSPARAGRRSTRCARGRACRRCAVSRSRCARRWPGPAWSKW